MRRLVPPRTVALLLSLAFGLCTSSLLPAQDPAPSSASAAQAEPEAPPGSTQQRLADLAAAHQAALEAGDSARVLASGRDLGAFALRLLGNLYVAHGQTARATESYQTSLAVEDSSDTRLDFALALLLSSRPDQALAEAHQVSAADPSNARAWTVSGQIHLEKGNLPAATDALRRAWQLAPDLDAGMLLLGAALRAGDAAEATRVSDRIVQSAGDHPRVHLLMANAHHTADDLPGTIAELTRAVSLDPALAAAHLALGDAFLELNEFQYNAGSLREFTEAQRLDPAGYLSDFDLGSILSKYERYTEAAPFLQKAAAADPLSPDPWLQLGMNAYAENRGADAIAALQKAVALTGSDLSRNSYQVRRVFAVLSRLEADAGDAAQAQAYAAREERLHAEVLHANIASTLSESTGLIVNNPPDPLSARPSSTTTASTAAALSPAEQALEQQLRSVVANSLNDAGTALARNHDYLGALPLFRQASLADPALSPVMRNLGLAAFHTEHYDEAITALSRALEQHPDDALAQNYLEQARALREGGAAARP